MNTDFSPIFSRLPADAPGYAVAIVHQGNVVFTHYAGMADLAHGIAVDSQTRFPVASISKMFTAALAGAIEQSGRVSMATPVKYLIDLNLPETLTLHHLLTMTSGLRETTELMPLTGSAKWMPRQMADHLALIRRCVTLNHEPGADYLYNNIGYFIAAAIIEKIHQRPFGDILRDDILSPLGMDSTLHWEQPEDIIPGLATGYTPNGRGYDAVKPFFPLNGGCSVVSTLDDMVAWLLAVRAGSVAGTDLQKLWQTAPLLSNGIQSGYAPGCMVMHHRGENFYGHTGGFAGYSSVLMHAPESDFGIVFMANSDSVRRDEMIDRILDHAGFSSVPPVAGHFNALQGDYIDDTTGEWISVAPQDGHINLQHLSVMRSLIPVMGRDDLLHQPIGNPNFYLPQQEDPSILKLIIGSQQREFKRIDQIEKASARLNDYIGRYQNEDIDSAQDIFMEDGLLKIRFGHFTNSHLTYTLIPTGKDMFRTEGHKPGWPNEYVLIFERESFSKMLRGYRLSHPRIRQMEFRRLRMA